MPSRVTIERLGNPKLAAVNANAKSIEGLCIALVALGKELVPRDTGELQNTIMAKGPDFEFGFNESSGAKAPDKERLDMPVPDGHAVFGTGSNHWYPEFGTRRQQAQPFIRPAAELLVMGGKAKNIVAKWNAEEMAKQFKEGKRQFSQYKSGEIVPESERV